MATIRPFKAIRPPRDKAHLLASRSYVSYSDKTLKEKLENNPYTFLHIINPEYKKKNKKSGIEKYQLVKMLIGTKKYLWIFKTNWYFPKVNWSG